jgi:hypothetical protein
MIEGRFVQTLVEEEQVALTLLVRFVGLGDEPE